MLSRTVNLKFKVLEIELTASILQIASPPGRVGVTNKPAKTVDNLGNVLVGDEVGRNDNQFGPVAFAMDAQLALPVVVELSFCSH